MTKRRATRIVAGAFVLALSLGRPRAALCDGDADAASANARAHFAKGDEHLRKGEYADAYDQFRRSLAAKRTRSALASLASTLKQLGRYDEALTLYEQALREFPNPPAAIEAKVAGEIKALHRLVGTLSLAGDLPEGATLTIDNVVRGKLPLTGKVVVSKGAHDLRLEKEGFEPITTSVDIQGGQDAVVSVVAPSKRGRLEVAEAHNCPVTVEVDGADVGQAPWEGLVETGEHRIRLHGQTSCESNSAPNEETKIASQVKVAVVRLYQVTRISLAAEPQDGALTVRSSPEGAAVWIDATEAGRAPWSGRLFLGRHTIEVKGNGYLPFKREVELRRREPLEIVATLERRPPDLQTLMTIRKVTLGVSFGLAAAGLGVGIATGALTLGKVSEIHDLCGGPTCPRELEPELNTIRALSDASTAGFVLAGVGAALGTAALFVLAPPKPNGASTRGTGALRVGLGPGRLFFSGSF